MMMLSVIGGSRTAGETSEELITPCQDSSYLIQHKIGCTDSVNNGRHCFVSPQITLPDSLASSGKGPVLDSTASTNLDQSKNLSSSDTEIPEQRKTGPPEVVTRTISPASINRIEATTQSHLQVQESSDISAGEFSISRESTTDDLLFPYRITDARSPTPSSSGQQKPSSSAAAMVNSSESLHRTADLKSESESLLRPADLMADSSESLNRTADMSSDSDESDARERDPTSMGLGPKCWLCGRTDPQEDLFRPCECPVSSGLLHKHCLLDWINTLYKGRCPRCAYMYRVVTDKTPWRKWKADTLLQQRRSRHIAAAVANLAFTSLIALALTLLLKPNDHINSFGRKLKLVLAALIALTFLLYTFYQVRLYMRLYERLKIFNNRVWDVCDVEEGKASNCQARGNLSDLINQSELNHNEFSSRGMI